MNEGWVERDRGTREEEEERREEEEGLHTSFSSLVDLDFNASHSPMDLSLSSLVL